VERPEQQSARTYDLGRQGADWRTIDTGVTGGPKVVSGKTVAFALLGGDFCMNRCVRDAYVDA
jgi:hypothetical protein